MNEQLPVYVIGAGGHAKVVISALEGLGRRVQAVFDDDPARLGQIFCGVPIVGPVDAANSHPPLPTVIAIGDNRARAAVAKRLNVGWQSVVDRNAIVDRSARIGAGSVLSCGAVVQADAVLGEHVIVNTASTIDHDCIIEDFVHLAPGVRLAGGVTIGEGAMLGIGSVVIPQIRIGRGTIVGAGAVVVGDLPENVLAVGVPARIMQRRNDLDLRKSA